MNRLIFTTLGGRRCYALASGNRVLQFEFDEEEAAEQIGTIYIGKVRNVVKNLNAAFVEYKPGINGYYSLNDNHIHTFADGTRSDRPLKSGDEIVVQISRAAVKTKDAVISGEITLSGRYSAVMIRDKNRSKLGISAKIKDKKWRDAFKVQWDECLSDSNQNSEFENIGVIIRTNAYKIDFTDVWNEVQRLKDQLLKISHDASFRTPFSVLHRPDSFAVSILRDFRLSDTTEVVTDIPEIFNELQTSGLCNANGPTLRYYEDDYSLSALYSLETCLERATSKNVWLKSGGYLVIEPTEAMTVIDVNTGKNIDKKSPEETYFRTNLEAAAEIAVQLRLRNISGIIIVDFIDMKEDSHNVELLSAFKQHLSLDPIKAMLIDMTPLGLVEVTRKKVKPPLHEQIHVNRSF